MARRDWDKMKRNDTVRSNGGLPHWLDNWAPSNIDPVPYYSERTPKKVSMQSKVDEPLSTRFIYENEYKGGTISLNLPPMIMEGTNELLPSRTIAVSKVTFVLSGLLDRSEQDLFADTLRGKIGRILDPSEFNQLLGAVMFLRRTSECDGHVTYEFERRSVIQCLKGKYLSAVMIKTILMKENPNLKGRELRDAVQAKVKSQYKAPKEEYRSASIIRAALREEKPGLTSNALREAVNEKLRLQSQPPRG